METARRLVDANGLNPFLLDDPIVQVRCRVRKSGVRCTVIATGKGFVISRACAARV
jgi:hypothetical protein